MISFSCPQCRTTYRFPDARAGDRIACSKCKYPVQIPPASVETGPRPAAPPIPKPPPLPSSVVAPVPPKGPSAPPPVPASVARPAPPPIPTSHVNPPAPSRVAPAPPPIPVSQARPPTAPRRSEPWYYEDAPGIAGPVSESELRAAAENARLLPDDRVWSDSMADWQPAIEVFPRLFDGLATGSKPDGQTKVAAALAAVAIGSLLLFGIVYAVKGGRKSEATSPATAERVRT